MNNKTIIILAAAIGIGAYFYFNNKKQAEAAVDEAIDEGTGGGTTGPGGPGAVTTDTGVDIGTDTGTGTTDDTGTDTTDGGTTVYPGAQTPDTPTSQEIDTIIAACVSVGGTWTTTGCIYSNSPNPRPGTPPNPNIYVEDFFDLGLGYQPIVPIVPIVNPKTGYAVNTINTNTNSGGGVNIGGITIGPRSSGTTPNYNIEFAGLSQKIFA